MTFYNKKAFVQAQTQTLSNLIGNPPAGTEAAYVRPNERDIAKNKWPADRAWAAAAGAFRVNEQQYVQYVLTDTAGNIIKRTNREVAINMLHDPGLLTEDDYEQGKEYRKHVNTWLMQLFKENTNDFVKTAVKIADKEEIAYGDLGILISLPQSINRDREFDRVADISRELKAKGTVGTIGNSVTGYMEVLQSYLSKKYNTGIVRANLDGHLVWFFSNTTFKSGNKYTIKGRVKRHDPDGSTQLHYVKILNP